MKPGGPAGLVEIVRLVGTQGLQPVGGRTESDNITLLLGTVAFVVVAAVVLTVVREVPKARRRRAEQQWAAERGWQVRGDQALAERMLGVFGLGSRCTVSHLVAGDYAGRPAMTFEYVEAGASASMHVHVVAVSLPVPLPALRLSPQALTDELAGALGGQDIVFESDDFNRAWRVRAVDGKYAHDVLHPRLMERLLAGDAQGVSVWVVGTDVLCWVPGTADLAAVDERLAVLTAFVDAIPRFVWLDHGYDPGPDAAGAVPAPAQGLPARTADRTVVSAAARATRRSWAQIVMTGFAVVASASLAVALAVMGLPELATWCGVIAVVLAGSVVARWLIGRSLRANAHARGL